MTVFTTYPGLVITATVLFIVAVVTFILVLRYLGNKAGKEEVNFHDLDFDLLMEQAMIDYEKVSADWEEQMFTDWEEEMRDAGLN